MNAVLQETQATSFQPYAPVGAQAEGTQAQEVQPKAQSLNIKANVLVKFQKFCKHFALDETQSAECALENYIEQYIEAKEDEEDLQDAIRIAAEIDAGRMKTYTLDEVKEELGL